MNKAEQQEPERVERAAANPASASDSFRTEAYSSLMSSDVYQKVFGGSPTQLSSLGFPDTSISGIPDDKGSFNTMAKAVQDQKIQEKGAKGETSSESNAQKANDSLSKLPEEKQTQVPPEEVQGTIPANDKHEVPVEEEKHEAPGSEEKEAPEQHEAPQPTSPEKAGEPHGKRGRKHGDNQHHERHGKHKKHGHSSHKKHGRGGKHHKSHGGKDHRRKGGGKHHDGSAEEDKEKKDGNDNEANKDGKDRKPEKNKDERKQADKPDAEKNKGNEQGEKSGKKLEPGNNRNQEAGPESKGDDKGREQHPVDKEKTPAQTKPGDKQQSQIGSLLDGEKVTRSVDDLKSFYRQQDDGKSCSAFSMAMAVSDQMLGRPIEYGQESRSFKELAGTTQHGYRGDLQSIADKLESKGLNAKAYHYDKVGSQTMDDLNKELDQGHSAIARVINPHTGNPHYIYVAGRDEKGKYVIGDPDRFNTQHFKPVPPDHLQKIMSGRDGFVATWGDQSSRAAQTPGTAAYRLAQATEKRIR